MTLDKMFLDSDPAQLDSSFPTSFFFNCYIYLFIYFFHFCFICLCLGVGVCEWVLHFLYIVKSGLAASF